MPAEVETCVEKLMADKDFYPEKTPEDRRSTAWGICVKQYQEKYGKSYNGVLFEKKKIDKEKNENNKKK